MACWGFPREILCRNFADSQHWDLVDLIAIVSREHKRTGSTAGHATADSSVLQPARVASAPQRIREVKRAIEQRDFERLADAVEEDSNVMHAVMMTSRPSLFYWQPLSLQIMETVRRWRREEGLQVCYTLDAGPNVHCICAAADAALVESKLRELSAGIDILRSGVGGPGLHFAY